MSSENDKIKKKTIKTVTILRKEHFDKPGVKEKLAEALEKIKKGKEIYTLLLAFVTTLIFFFDRQIDGVVYDQGSCSTS